MERTRYRSIVSDNARWDGFQRREGDVIISTPPKCGTTWMQMCCALLIFDGPDLPAPLTELSPWLDMQAHAVDTVLATLDAQEHRRFIKSHTPLDGLPWDPSITYICVGRDPRDVALSWDGHMANMDFNAFIQARLAAGPIDELDTFEMPPIPPPDPVERFWFWVQDDTSSVGGLRSTLHHLETFWSRRDEPNIALFHYADMKADLPGELRRLADALAIEVSDDRLGELAAEASFEQMKRRADELAPETDINLWQSSAQFFKRGTNGGWRELIDEADLAPYDQRVAELATPELAQWLRTGWRGADSVRR